MGTNDEHRADDVFHVYVSFVLTVEVSLTLVVGFETFHAPWAHSPMAFFVFPFINRMINRRGDECVAEISDYQCATLH